MKVGYFERRYHGRFKSRIHIILKDQRPLCRIRYRYPMRFQEVDTGDGKVMPVVTCRQCLREAREQLRFRVLDQTVQHFMREADIGDEIAAIFIRAALSVREVRCLVWRFWYGDTYAEIGKKDGGYSRERVRQIIAKALRKLRHPRVIGDTDILDWLPESAAVNPRDRLYAT